MTPGSRAATRYLASGRGRLGMAARNGDAEAVEAARLELALAHVFSAARQAEDAGADIDHLREAVDPDWKPLWEA